MKRVVSRTPCRRLAHLDGDPSIAMLGRNTTKSEGAAKKKGVRAVVLLFNAVAIYHLPSSSKQEAT
jgi:hypothetical protein